MRREGGFCCRWSCPLHMPRGVQGNTITDLTPGARLASLACCKSSTLNPPSSSMCHVVGASDDPASGHSPRPPTSKGAAAALLVAGCPIMPAATLHLPGAARHSYSCLLLQCFHLHNTTAIVMTAQHAHASSTSKLPDVVTYSKVPLSHERGS